MTGRVVRPLECVTPVPPLEIDALRALDRPIGTSRWLVRVKPIPIRHAPQRTSLVRVCYSEPHAATPGGGLVERVGETSQPAVHRGLEIGVLDAGEG